MKQPVIKFEDLPKELSIKLTIESWQLITQTLSKLPYDMAALTIETIVGAIEKESKCASTKRKST